MKLPIRQDIPVFVKVNRPCRLSKHPNITFEIQA